MSDIFSLQVLKKIVMSLNNSMCPTFFFIKKGNKERGKYIKKIFLMTFCGAGSFNYINTKTTLYKITLASV